MSALFSTPPPPPLPAEPKPPAPMPDPQSPDVLEAKRRAQADMLRRAGRSSTILTTPEDRGGRGFDSYSSGRLGSGA